MRFGLCVSRLARLSEKQALSFSCFHSGKPWPGAERRIRRGQHRVDFRGRKISGRDQISIAAELSAPKVDFIGFNWPKLMTLMAKMADAGEDHREIAFVGGGDDFFVTD